MCRCQAARALHGIGRTDITKPTKFSYDSNVNHTMSYITLTSAKALSSSSSSFVRCASILTITGTKKRTGRIAGCTLTLVTSHDHMPAKEEPEIYAKKGICDINKCVCDSVIVSLIHVLCTEWYSVE